LNQQLLSPLSDGLLHRSIAESGSAAMDMLVVNNPIPSMQVGYQGFLFGMVHLGILLILEAVVFTVNDSVLRWLQMHLAVASKAQRRLLNA